MPRLIILVLLGTVLGMAQTLPRGVTDPGVVVTRQNITPAGVQSVFGDRVWGVRFGETNSDLWVLGGNQIFHLEWRANRVLQHLPLGGRPGLQGIVFDAKSKRALVSSVTKEGVRLVAVENGNLRVLAERLGTSLGGSPALQGGESGGRRAVVLPLTANNKLAVIDAADGRLLGTAETGIAPFGAVISGDGAVTYVSNWGGRFAVEKDRTAPAGLAKNADRVVIDRRGIAATGTVTRIDLRSLKVTATIAVGLHPTALVWDEARQRLYAANGNSDSVAVVDTRQNRLLSFIPLQPFEKHIDGVAPTALALNKEGSKLYVACGGINAIAVVNTTTGRTEGLIPTAWYPNAVALSPDDKYLVVGAMLGVGSGWRDEPRKRFVHSYRGTVSVLPVPDAAQLASYSTAVAENNHLETSPVTLPAATARPRAIPLRAGEPSLIDHVVYIIKENRTYDQVFGDMPKGNGDPSLVLFGVDVTPNQHRLADQFVLLDNFYASGGNSGDGHQWITQANETDYAMWPGWTGRSYPFDGTDPIAYASRGFLWDYALRANRKVRVYGEFVPRQDDSQNRQRSELLERWQRGDDFSNEWNVSSPIPPLDSVLARNFPGFSTTIPDVIRAKLFVADVRKWDAEGSMPNLVMLLLPSNHTRGTAPGTNTPKAMVADNDLALGRVVEALTHTRFWKKMAIFVVEDDAQDGVDHVDGHRTVALAVSPYVRRGHVDSTFYAHTSMVKTIELILGLPTMSLFDLIANDMRASFTDEANDTPFTAVEPRQSLFEMNPAPSSLRGEARRAARDSMKMRFDVPDAAPTERLNRIVWHQARGWDVPYPGVKRAVFAPVSFDLDDDARGDP